MFRLMFDLFRLVFGLFRLVFELVRLVILFDSVRFKLGVIHKGRPHLGGEGGQSKGDKSGQGRGCSAVSGHPFQRKKNRGNSFR